MRFGKFAIWAEKPGVISEGPCWVAVHSCWMYTHDTLVGLLWTMIREWKQDRHLCG